MFPPALLSFEVNRLMALVCIIYELFSPTLASERGQRLNDRRNLSLRHHCMSSQELFVQEITRIRGS